MKKIKLFIVILTLYGTFPGWGQSQQQIKSFELKDVQLKESVFEDARYTALQYILELEPDRLLYPFLREAGLEPKAESYPNWENSGLDGHIGGHYLTALSMMYASTGDKEVLGRLEYMLDELKRCQDSYGNGYIGGVPNSRELWNEVAAGELKVGNFDLNNRWVPLYNIHKTYAGLRDAYLLADSELAREMLIDYTDWIIDVTTDLSHDQVQRILQSEHGGLNEVFADVAEITGDKKYLELAYDFSHEDILDPLVAQEDKLNGLHANTQIPKVVGFQAIAAISGDEDLHSAAKFFWENVVNKRTVAIGGNSVREHFHPTSDFSSMISSEQGPETCNTYNMLKLSKKLFEAEGLEKYIDFYEQGLYNHILSSQHPEGGFVYFTPIRPGHYRVYSQPETSFWCCVGSGLENHAKYNELIYAHTDDELYINLFIPSAVKWEEKGFTLIQETAFPNEESSTFLIETESPQELNIKLRHPSWVAKGELEVLINGKTQTIEAEPGSFVDLHQKWKQGDQIELRLPMYVHSEVLPDGSNYEALKYGPLVLATVTGNEDLLGLFADDSRGGHVAEGRKIPLNEMPMFITEEPDNIKDRIKKVPGRNLTFSASEVLYPEKFSGLEFVPFYHIHESRYAIYLPVETPESLQEIQERREKLELEEQELEAVTIDMVSPGEQQPESDHFVKSERSSIGVNRDRHWRDARGWFSYELRDEKKLATQVRVTYFGEDSGRDFKILINDKFIAEEKLDGVKGSRFFDVDYRIPEEILKKHNGTLVLKFEAAPGSVTAGVYEIRLMKDAG